MLYDHENMNMKGGTNIQEGLSDNISKASFINLGKPETMQDLVLTINF